jgi:hypothetical protein
MTEKKTGVVGRCEWCHEEDMILQIVEISKGRIIDACRRCAMIISKGANE